MALNFGKQYNGINLVPQNTIAPSANGDIRYNSNTNKAELYNGAVDPLVTEADTATLTNKTLTGNTAANLVNGSGTFQLNSSGTITTPNATDTLVGKATTDTLTNKTLTGNTAANLINGAGTTNLNSTGTVTLPNATDTLVGKATTDTLTNKTIAAGSNTISGLTNTNLSGSAAISNANLAAMANNTVKGNISGSSATPSDVAISSIVAAGGGVTSVGAFDTEGTPAANALTITSNAIIAQSASATVPGMVNTTTQTMAGAKTFSTSVSSPAVTGSTSVQSPSHIVTGTGGNVTIAPATGTTSAYTLKLPASQGSSSTTLQNDGSGNLTWALGGTGGGLKNYLGSVNSVNYNGNFETGTTYGGGTDTWGNGNAAFTSGVPSSGPTFGGTSGISIVSSGQLAGTYSLQTVAQATTVGTAILTSPRFTIDLEDQAKVLALQFSYKPTSGTANAVWSGDRATQSFSVWIYDFTNGAWIQPTGWLNMIQSSGGVGIFTGAFQTPPNGSQFGLFVFVQNAIAGAVTLLIDDVFCGPAPAGSIQSPLLTEWVAYTPTFVGLGTVTGTQFFSRRVGDTLEVQGNFTTGTVTATQVNISLGYNGSNANVTANLTKIPTGSNNMIVGTGVWGTATANSLYTLIFNGTPGSLLLGAQGSGQAGLSAINGTFLGSTTAFSVIARVPIQGWSAFDGGGVGGGAGSIAAHYLNNASTAISTSIAKIPFPTKDFDATNSMNGATGDYTVPVSGKYLVSANLTILISAGNEILLNVYKNGVYNCQISYGITGGGGIGGISGSVPLDLIAGDVISIWSSASASGTLTTSGSARNNFGIALIAPAASNTTSPAVTALIATGTPAASTNNTPIIFPTITRDTMGSYNATTGRYTIPSTGFYQIGFSTSSTAYGATTLCYIYVNGAASYATGFGIGSGQAFANAGMYLTAGDIIDARTSTTSTSPGASLFSIFKIGNV